MPVKTSRASENGRVSLDAGKCTACGLCAKVCKSGVLSMRGGKVVIDYARGLGCVACGHCASICPRECITVEGRDLAPGDIVPLPPREARATFEALNALLLSRRSVREFEPREVEKEVIDKIIAAATTAPMGIPPTDVKVLIFNGREKMREFRRDMLDALKGMRRIFSPAMLRLWRPLMGKEAIDMFRTFLMPLIDGYMEGDKEGVDLFSYDAPLGMLFYCAPPSDSADSLIAATYAMIAAESLGLGSCMLGFPAPVINRSKRLKAKYGLEPKAKVGVFIIYGYPALKFQRAVKRRFAGIRYW